MDSKFDFRMVVWLAAYLVDKYTTKYASVKTCTDNADRAVDEFEDKFYKKGKEHG